MFLFSIKMIPTGILLLMIFFIIILMMKKCSFHYFTHKTCWNTVNFLFFKKLKKQTLFTCELKRTKHVINNTYLIFTYYIVNKKIKTPFGNLAWDSMEAAPLPPPPTQLPVLHSSAPHYRQSSCSAGNSFLLLTLWSKTNSFCCTSLIEIGGVTARQQHPLLFTLCIANHFMSQPSWRVNVCHWFLTISCISASSHPKF